MSWNKLLMISIMIKIYISQEKVGIDLDKSWIKSMSQSLSEPCML